MKPVTHTHTHTSLAWLLQCSTNRKRGLFSNTLPPLCCYKTVSELPALANHADGGIICFIHSPQASTKAMASEYTCKKQHALWNDSFVQFNKKNKCKDMNGKLISIQKEVIYKLGMGLEPERMTDTLACTCPQSRREQPQGNRPPVPAPRPWSWAGCQGWSRDTNPQGGQIQF